MSVAKVIEVICEGKTIEDAINAGLKEAANSVKNIKHVDVDHIHANVKDNRVDSYRVITKITFVVE
ncbi:MAG: dodecin family protein [Simkaniaceae bacterium]|nr:dodecin family protein [Candidatus Sacchlamyda saccharinae]